jgi:DNA repair protein RecN (Recombination protein N)
MLQRLGRQHQVMCITHLPQVAAAANAQLQVSKATANGAVLSSVKVLETEQRVDELARMLGGVKITDTTRKHAAEMLHGATDRG